jgi:hypothetical protein
MNTLTRWMKRILLTFGRYGGCDNERREGDVLSPIPHAPTAEACHVGDYPAHAPEGPAIVYDNAYAPEGPAIVYDNAYGWLCDTGIKIKVFNP